MDKRLHLPLKKNKKGGGGGREVKHRKDTGGIVISELYIFKCEVAINACIIVSNLLFAERL